MYFSPSEEKVRLKRQYVQQAISLALQSNWEEAVRVNQNILELNPEDVDALNRLGKAHFELSQFKESLDAYSRTLDLDQNNSIAMKNVERLKKLLETATRPKAPAEPVSPQLFIEEIGKTGIISLSNLGDPNVLASMAAGDKVVLKTSGKKLIVASAQGEQLGEIESKLAQRLRHLMSCGNKYSAAVTSIEPSQVKIIIREIHQDPGCQGEVSFPGSKMPEVRPYIKGRILKYDLDEEELYGEEVEELGEGGNNEEFAPEADFEDELIES